MELVKEPVKTGDILLFNYRDSWFSWAIKFFTRSNYSHVGMVVVDPQFTEIPLKGVYLWESGRGYIPDPENHRLKTGVQLTPMDQVFKTFEGKGNVYLRRLKAPDGLITEDKLKIVHTAVHNKPYDIVPSDWIQAFLRVDPSPQKISRFWCSALVGYIYTKVGMAYGFLIDNAYIIDTDNNIEFFLTASVYSNNNETLNDDRYEYDEITLPFMAELGTQIYKYELSRKKSIAPDFSRFIQQ